MDASAALLTVTRISKPTALRTIENKAAAIKRAR
jgi:hypothetical protein